MCSASSVVKKSRSIHHEDGEFKIKLESEFSYHRGHSAGPATDSLLAHGGTRIAEDAKAQRSQGASCLRSGRALGSETLRFQERIPRQENSATFASLRPLRCQFLRAPEENRLRPPALCAQCPLWLRTPDQSTTRPRRTRRLGWAGVATTRREPAREVRGSARRRCNTITAQGSALGREGSRRGSLKGCAKFCLPFDLRSQM